MTAQIPFTSRTFIFFLSSKFTQRRNHTKAHSLTFYIKLPLSLISSLTTTNWEELFSNLLFQPLLLVVFFSFYGKFFLLFTFWDLYFVFSSTFYIIHGLGVMTFNLLRGCNKAQKIMSFHDDRVNDDKLIRYHQCNLFYNVSYRNIYNFCRTRFTASNGRYNIYDV